MNTRHQTTLAIAFFTAVSVLPASSLNAGALYQVTDLGSLGGNSVFAGGINALGQTVGSAQTASGATHAFSSDGKTLVDLSTAAGKPGLASGINGQGSIAGTTYSPGGAAATVWTSAGVQYLPGLGGTDSYALAINNAGQVAGMATTADGQGHAFLTVNGQILDIGALSGGSWSSAYAINASGAVAGYAMNDSGTFNGFIFTAGGGIRQLGTLGGSSSYALAINDNGQAAGSSTTGSGYSHAFVTNGTGLRDLGTLGGESSYAYGIDNAGNVVGYSSLASGGNSHAFLYRNGLLIDLNSLIGADSGWELTQAMGINGSGQIVGDGWYNGTERAFRLDPIVSRRSLSAIANAAVPEPSPAALYIVGLLGFAALAIRRRSQIR